MGPELKNHPLVEALFEVRWTPNEPGIIPWKDPAYPLYVGAFYESLKNSYPSIESLPAGQIPDELTAGVAKYRFRRSSGGWPLIQAGPGVATVNFTERYSWDAFRGAVADFYPKLRHAYTLGGEKPPLITGAILRYINAIEIADTVNLIEFLESKLHTVVALPDEIVKSEHVAGMLSAIELKVGQQTSRPKGVGTLTFTTGKKNDKPAVVWDLSIVSRGEDAPQEAAAVDEWIAQAHDVIDAWFFTLVKGDLQDLFSGGETDGPTAKAS